MGSCREIYTKAKKKKVTPILGVEGYFRDDKCPILLARGLDPAKHLKYTHITLHALDQPAYYALVQEISNARTERHGQELKPLFDWGTLERLGAHNITAGSGCLVGMVQRHLLAHADRDVAEQYFLRLKAIFKTNFYAEVFPHKCTHNWAEGVNVTTSDGRTRLLGRKKNLVLAASDGTTLQIKADELAERFRALPPVTIKAIMQNRKYVDMENETPITNVAVIEEFVENECLPWAGTTDVQAACNSVVLEFAQKHQVPVVISDDAHYGHPDEKAVQDIRLRQSGSWRFFGTYNRQSAEESWNYFSQYDVSSATFEGWVNNNLEWADRFKNFALIEPPSLPVSFYPGNSRQNTINKIVEVGRMPVGNPVYKERLKQELELLGKNGTIDLLPYPMPLTEICSLYEENGFLSGPGRGSAAGVLLHYLLGITHVDPIKYGLSLDRFLTQDRIASGKLPDIDQDLPDRAMLDEGVDWPMIELEFDDGRKVDVRPDHQVVGVDGKAYFVEDALEKQLDIADWRLP